ncbi:Mu transposase C-terminal domain-containing protein, partial [Escherichia coli]
GMPGTAQGVRYSIRKLASSEHFRRKRAGSKTIEYSIDCLPPVTQRALRERHVAQLMATAPQEITTQPPVKRERKQNVVQPVEAYRGSPQLVEERLNALTENQRKVAEARIALVCEVLRISQEPGFSCASAIRFIVSRLAQGNLEERLESLVITANA